MKLILAKFQQEKRIVRQWMMAIQCKRIASELLKLSIIKHPPCALLIEMRADVMHR